MVVYLSPYFTGSGAGAEPRLLQPLVFTAVYPLPYLSLTMASGRRHNSLRSSSQSQRPALNPKTPPGWDPANDDNYTLREFADDLRTWLEIASPNIAPTQYGALVKLQMGGLARKLVDSIPAENLANGLLVDYGDGAGALPCLPQG